MKKLDMRKLWVPLWAIVLDTAWSMLVLMGIPGGVCPPQPSWPSMLPTV
ncbi:MAG TPA: hypothetical protein VLI07_10515 [Candidatus Binatus sp.]|nr:hypothetical protein [Candidatus Binatus sp.]